MIVYWILLVLLIWIVLVYFMQLFLFPGFLRDVKVKISPKSRKIAGLLKGRNKTETLRKIFSYVEKKYSSERYKLFFLLDRHFYTKVDKIIDKRMFLPCHVQNLILRTLLVSAGFSENNIKKKITMIPWGTIHEYSLIKADKRIFKTDPFYNILDEVKE